MAQSSWGQKPPPLLQPLCVGISFLTLGNAKVSRTLLPTQDQLLAFCVSSSTWVQPLEHQDKRWSRAALPTLT